MFFAVRRADGFSGSSPFFSGCMVGPNYKQPKTEMPKGWSEIPAQGVTTESASNLARWWSVFNDPALDNLIRKSNRGQQGPRGRKGKGAGGARPAKSGYGGPFSVRKLVGFLHARPRQPDDGISPRTGQPARIFKLSRFIPGRLRRQLGTGYLRGAQKVGGSSQGGYGRFRGEPARRSGDAAFRGLAKLHAVARDPVAARNCAAQCHDTAADAGSSQTPGSKRGSAAIWTLRRPRRSSPRRRPPSRRWNRRPNRPFINWEFFWGSSRRRLPRSFHPARPFPLRPPRCRWACPPICCAGGRTFAWLNGSSRPPRQESGSRRRTFSRNFRSPAISASRP